MGNGSQRSKKFNQVSLLILGFVWIAIALFGLIFDPEKKVIIISQIVIGCCALLFLS
jgi:hypothetical protein